MNGNEFAAYVNGMKARVEASANQRRPREQALLMRCRAQLLACVAGKADTQAIAQLLREMAEVV